MEPIKRRSSSYVEAKEKKKVCPGNTSNARTLVKNCLERASESFVGFRGEPTKKTGTSLQINPRLGRLPGLIGQIR